MSSHSPDVHSFGRLDGRDIREIVLGSADGSMTVSIIELGATVRDLQVRRLDGAMQRVVLGLNSVEDYRRHSPHLGAIAGRYGNRIGGGRFVLDGVAYQLPLNENGRTALHGGGATGFGKIPWTLLHADGASVTLALHSRAGDNGYPGALTISCRYVLLAPTTLRVELSAFTDAPTVLNPCHHSYFNLDGSADALDHQLTVRSDLYAPVDADSIPNGTLAPVAGTHLDFRTPRIVGGAVVGDGRPAIDNTFLLRRDRCESDATSGLELVHAATLTSSRSGLGLECWTTEPALQVYDGSKVNVAVPGLDGVRYGACAGIALEPQHVPDSPNLPHFPTTVLRPGLLYRQITEFRFA